MPQAKEYKPRLERASWQESLIFLYTASVKTSLPYLPLLQAKGRNPAVLIHHRGAESYRCRGLVVTGTPVFLNLVLAQVYFGYAAGRVREGEAVHQHRYLRFPGRLDRMRTVS